MRKSHEKFSARINFSLLKLTTILINILIETFEIETYMIMGAKSFCCFTVV